MGTAATVHLSQHAREASVWMRGGGEGLGGRSTEEN